MFLHSRLLILHLTYLPLQYGQVAIENYILPHIIAHARSFVKISKRCRISIMKRKIYQQLLDWKEKRNGEVVC